MSKIDQKTVLRSLSVSSLCLFLSLSSALAMEEEERPSTSASLSALLFSPPPEEQRDLTREQRGLTRERLSALKKLNPPPEHSAGFNLIDETRRNVNDLLDEISRLKSFLPSTSFSPGETSGPDESALGDRKKTPPETWMIHNPQTLSVINQIYTSLNQLTEALRPYFGFVQTTFGYWRFSETFHRRALDKLEAQKKIYRQKDPANEREHTEVLKVLDQASPTLVQRIEAIGRDARFKSYWKVGRNPIGYALIEPMKNTVVITVPPTSFHLFAAMMDLLNETHKSLGTLPRGEPLPSKESFEYGIYGDYVEEYKMHWEEKVSQSSSAS